MEQKNYRCLYRLEEGRLIFGVCAGLAEYFEVDPTIVRIIMVLLAFGAGFGIILYIILAFITPQKGKTADPKGTARVSTEETAERIRQIATSLCAIYRSFNFLTNSRLWLGSVVLFLGIFFLFHNLSIFSWLNIDILWPLIIIMVGLFLLFKRK